MLVEGYSTKSGKTCFQMKFQIDSKIILHLNQSTTSSTTNSIRLDSNPLPLLCLWEPLIGVAYLFRLERVGFCSALLIHLYRLRAKVKLSQRLERKLKHRSNFNFLFG